MCGRRSGRRLAIKRNAAAAAGSASARLTNMHRRQETVWVRMPPSSSPSALPPPAIAP